MIVNASIEEICTVLAIIPGRRFWEHGGVGEAIFPYAVVLLFIFAVLMVVNQQRKRKRRQTGTQGTTISATEMDIFLCMQFVLDNAETVLNNHGKLYPMAMVLLRDGKTDYYNWQNTESTVEDAEKWLAERAGRMYYSLVVVDDPTQSRLILADTLWDASPEPQITTQSYTTDGGKYKLAR